MFTLLLLMALIGCAAWALVRFIPMPPAIKTVIIIVAVIACVVIALQAFGVRLPNPSVPQVK